MKILLLLFTLACTIPVTAQRTTLNRANKFFGKLSYYRAVPLYLRVLQIDSTNTVALHNVAECYRKMNDYKNKETYYAKVVKLPDVTPLDQYNYGMALMENDKMTEGQKWIGLYAKSLPTTEPVETKLTESDKLKYFWHDSSTASYTVRNFSQVNGDHSDFGPIYFGKGILFSSNHYILDSRSNNHAWTGKDFYKIFYFDSLLNGQKPLKFSASVQSRLNDGPLSYDKKEKLLYVTRNNVQAGKEIRSKDDLTKLQIYSYKYDEANQEWSNEIAFDNNNKDYNMAHPAVSPDGTYMIFSSDMPGGYGGMDLYICKKRADRWGIPINLGPKVNTKFEEVFPFVNADNLLIYSSNGMGGLGGLDFYYTYLSDVKPGIVEHFGAPVNSMSDDFSMVLTDDSKKALFSSNRAGGLGDDDIYILTIQKKIKPVIPKPPKLIFDLSLKGLVRDKKTLAALDSVKVIIRDERALTYKGLTKPQGTFMILTKQVKVNDTIHWTIILEKRGYLREELPFTYVVKDSIVDLNKFFDLLMTPLEAVVAQDLIGKDLMKKFIINPIYFDFDKYNIRPDAAIELDKIVKILKQYPSMFIDLTSHTDCIGTELYNMKLSDNRAKSTVAYLVAKGISKKRFTAKGYGESRHVNECRCEGDVISTCTPEMHQLNRRTEFIVRTM
jgi:outer membrane protein OmpA-like peptidoglycan-associated protein/tetratricopeptide (TPR) repeat protein